MKARRGYGTEEGALFQFRVFSHAGFTLIELLVAITVLSIIMGIVYAGMSSVTDTMDIARAQAAYTRQRQFLAQTLSDCFAAVYCDPGCEVSAFALRGEDKDGPFGPGDTLRFVTALPLPGSNALPGILRSVTLSLVDNPADMEGGTLDRFTLDVRETDEEPTAMLRLAQEGFQPSGQDNEFMGEKMSLSFTTPPPGAQIRLIPARTLDILYYDNETEEWVTSWDSQSRGHLPWAVRVRVNFAGDREVPTDTETYADFDMTYTLPTGLGTLTQFIDVNHRFGTATAGGAEGKAGAPAPSNPK